MFVTYYRVSTQRQGQSGLGLEAQRSAVQAFLTGKEIIAEFTEIESGRKNNRPQLAAALALAKKQKATLVIAKLDRLARNVHFISGLLESNVQFVAADMPTPRDTSHPHLFAHSGTYVYLSKHTLPRLSSHLCHS